MKKATYTRFQGKRYTYEIVYDGFLPKAYDRALLTLDEAMDRGLFSAEIDIEGLIGMDE